ncbi:MAG TPA: glycosyltransferase family 39 protein [Tepidisphaeraceae bacterium]|jgi:hypothetical protein
MERVSLIDYMPPGEGIRPLFKPLPAFRTESAETRGHRAVAAALAFAIAVAYFLLVLQYWAPAHSGVDQNGYLVGGKQLAWTGSTGLKPAEPLGFVSSMWVLNEKTGVSYPKYPVGLPLLYAIVLWTCGSVGPKAAFLISPVTAATAVLGMYFLTRRFAGAFASLMAMLVMAFGQVMLVLANNPNSHASCLAFCVWGVFLLIRFWETGTLWRGVTAGFLLGFAATIRYTEGLLALLIAFTFVGMVDWRSGRSWLRCLTPTLGWLIPVAYLVGFNLIAMGTITGYDTTNESVPGSAFTLEHMGLNWEKLVRQVHDTGLFFTLPLGLLGMGLALRSGVRRGTLLWLWLVPGTLTYMAYYWAPERGVSYLRFFLTLMPPIVVGVGVLIDQLVSAASVARLPRVVTPVACGLVVAVACSMSLYRGLFGLDEGQETGIGLESQFRQQVNLAALGDVVTQTAPAGSVLIAPVQQLNALQFIGDYDCFSTETFTAAYATRLNAQKTNRDPDDPDPIQPARRNFLLKQIDGKNDDQLAQEQIGIVSRALSAGRRAFILCRRDQTAAFTKRYEAKSLDLTWKPIAFYNDLPRLQPPTDRPPSTDPRARGGPNRPRPGGPGGPGRGGRGNFAGREVTAQAWQLIEIKRRAG